MQHASAEALDHDHTAPVSPPRKQSGRVIPFRPRASSLAYTWIASHGFGPVTTRTLQAIADRSRYATDADKRDKVQAGEIFTFARAKCFARDLGTSDRSVRRAVKQARAAGLLTVRKGHRAAVSYVWAAPAEIPAAGVWSGRSGGRSKPRRSICSNHKESEPLELCTVPAADRKAIKHPEAPATQRQRDTIRAMAAERGLGEPWLDGMTRGAAHWWIYDVRAAGGLGCKKVTRPHAPPTDEQIDLLKTIACERRIAFDWSRLPAFTRADVAGIIEDAIRERGAA